MSNIDKKQVLDLGFILNDVKKIQLVTFTQDFKHDPQDKTKEIHLINLKHISMDSKYFPKQIADFILKQQEINNVKETSESTIRQLRFLGNLMINYAHSHYQYLPSIYRRTVFEDMTHEAEILL